MIVESHVLLRVANGATQYARRLRELRAEGWRISSHHDRADLAPGQYVLEEDPPTRRAYLIAKPISKRVRALVLERNGYTCQMCGAGAGDADDENPGRTVRLHIGHIVDRQHGGSDERANLRALCSACNQGAQDHTPAPPSRVQLLGHVRRANVDDQRAALLWLMRKFEKK